MTSFVLTDMLLRHLDGEDLDREIFCEDMRRRLWGIPSFRFPYDFC